jgi:8-oxo-dGTP diphosphatase
LLLLKDMPQTPDAGNRTPSLTGASIAVMKPRDGVLLVQRGGGIFQGLWSFPGGRSEAGESAEATARRELLEETGLTVEALIRLGRFLPAPGRSPVFLTVFAARPADYAAPRAGDDALRAEFVPFAQVLARPLTPAAPGWIARALRALYPEL